MKPEQFIREFGERKAREVVEGAPARSNWYQVKGRYSNDLYSCNHELYGEAIMLSDLKRLVESVDLVNSYGGLQGARKEAHRDCFTFEKNKPLLRAINDYESIYGEGNE
ncbi:hypothetical protein [Acinetobacter baumannii]|uniref:hypothetical protein n=1 Tax=Acinetobacter baumannii TaxID=470 RepID=UPI0027419446|nr:hypothetical protein [Acinetobacter baumannii]MDP7763605.1 hypothetical protein [Acinetobacter baumannii]